MSNGHAIAVSESKPTRVAKRQQRSVSERRRMVEQTLTPGASVKAVAEANGVRPNQLFKWRRQYRDGRLGTVALGSTLLPVRIVSVVPKAPQKPIKPENESAKEFGRRGCIRIEFPHSRLLIEGVVDSAALRTVLEYLSR